MTYQLNDTLYTVQIERKKNKNTYIRVKDNHVLLVTTGPFTSNHAIYDLLEKNKKELLKMAQNFEKKKLHDEKFYYLGSSYDIIIVPTLETIDIVKDKLYVKSEKELQKFLDQKRKTLFLEHYQKQYDRFQEEIHLPKLKIRSMKTRWGVYNRRANTITLNAKLIEYPLVCLDYVIIHELSHLLYFDHSKNFWNVVAKYCPEYKTCRNLLKEE